MRHVAVVLFLVALEIVQGRRRISGAVVGDAEDGPGIVLAAGERRPVENGPNERHRVMARIAAVGTESGELVIDGVSRVRSCDGWIDMEDDTAAAGFGRRGGGGQKTVCVG